MDISRFLIRKHFFFEVIANSSLKIAFNDDYWQKQWLEKSTLRAEIVLKGNTAKKPWILCFHFVGSLSRYLLTIAPNGQKQGAIQGNAPLKSSIKTLMR